MPENARTSVQDEVPRAAAVTGSAPSLWLLLLIGTLALTLRIDDPGFVTESLFWEDGVVYLTQAHTLGWRSLWIPYMSYLNTYPRIVALLTSQAPLVAAPYLFFCAWFASFYSIVWVLRSRASGLGNNAFMIAFLVIAIALQPNHATAFFILNTTNVFLGVALVLYICTPSNAPPTSLEVVFLALASISGPYSAFMLPVLAAQLVLFRDFSVRRSFYLVAAAGGLIQLTIMMFDETRSAQLPGYADWTRVIRSLLLFGDGSKLSVAAASAFWLITLVYTIKLAGARMSRAEARSCLHPVFALVSAAGLFLVGAVAAASISLLPFYSPMDLVSHNFIIPYSLAFLAALVSTQNHRAAQIAVMCLMSTICGARFVTVDDADRATSTGLASHANMQWIAFTKFQSVKPDLIIPTNSELPVYPPMNKVQVTRTAAPSIGSNAVLLDIGSSTNSSSLELRIDEYCGKSDYIGLEIHVWRSRMGYAEVSWGRSGHFDSDRSMRRFYPGKDAVMQFAFHRDPSEDSIRLELAQGVAPSPTVSIMNKQKSDLTADGFVVAEPTAAGGSVKIERILLYCLQ